jgi:hypothetical protein
MSEVFHTSLPLRTPDDADPAVSAPLKAVQAQMGMVPNMYGAMVNLPALLDTYNRGGRVGLHRDRQRISGSSAGCFLEVPIWGVMQGGRSPTGVTPHIGGRIHAAIASGRLSKYVWSGVLAARLECGLFPL